MKNSLLAIMVLLIGVLSIPGFSQTEDDAELLGLPGDNLDLYAVLNLFQKSPTIEDFEKSLNDEETGINNLDLNLDDKVDFIKVKTEQNKEDFTFILQVDVAEKETQDVAVILLSKDKDVKVTLQIVGDKDLYGKDYVVEPAPPTPAVTPNPAYTGTEPVPEAAPASTTVVVVESAPIVQYVYSPVYVPYYPPYYYGYYPPYFRATAVIAVGIYRHNNYYYHRGYHGGRGNTVVIHNHNTYNNYNNNRSRSNTVNHNKTNGNYNRGNGSTRPSNGASGANKPSTRPSNGASGANKPSTRPSNGTSGANKPSTRPSNGASGVNKPSTRPSSGSSGTTRPSTTPSTRQASPSTRQSTTRQSSPSPSRSYSGGGRSGSSGASRGGSGRGGRR